MTPSETPQPHTAEQPAPQPPAGYPAPAPAAGFPPQPPPVAYPAPPPGYPAPPPAGPAVVQTDTDAKDGLKRCPRCGSSDIALNIATGQLRCTFCRYEAPAVNALQYHHLDGGSQHLHGVVVGSGSADIIPDAAEVMTFKCAACGAEVVVDTKSSMQARCHWCRNTLSVNEQIPNGAVPDMILPFSVTKEQAVAHITAFVGKRMTFAHPRFKAEFQPGNVMGVYLPYMVVDANTKIAMRGQGEHLVRKYTRKVGDKTVTYYDADLFDISRAFDLYIDDLTVESSSQRLDQTPSRNSNNIINTIMPFDVENSVIYDSNYLTGFASEKRDTNMTDLAPIMTAQAQDIARYQARAITQFYDRGVRWDDERISIVGQRWVSAYLPVWLYSYFDAKKGYVHYVAVNGRTGETMGSVPVNYPKLLLISAVIEIVAIVAAVLVFVVGA